MHHYKAELIRPGSRLTFLEAKGTAADVDRQLRSWKGSSVRPWMNALVLLAIGGILALVVVAMVTDRVVLLAWAVVPGAVLTLIGVLQSRRARATDSRKRDLALNLTRHLEGLVPGSRFEWRVDARAMDKFFTGPSMLFTGEHREKHKVV